MNIEEMLQSELEHAAARLDAPVPHLDEVMSRGSRRRGLRTTALVGSAVACLGLAVGVTAAVAGFRAPAAPVAAPSPLPVEEVAGGVVGTIEGTIVVDGDGLSVRPTGGGAAHRILEAHTLQLGGRPSFGPALSDGAGGFVYSMVEISDTATRSSGQVLWVPAGETTPRLVTTEAVVGVGEVIGIVEGSNGDEVVYTTAAGRTAAVRIIPLEGGSARTARTVVEGINAAAAAGRHIVGTSHTEGCTQLRIFTTSAVERSVDVPGGPCQDIRSLVLSPDGSSAAYLDHTSAGAVLTVVSTTTGRTLPQWIVGEGQLVAFDGQYAYMDGKRRVAVETGVVESNVPSPTDVFQINDRLVLQTPPPDSEAVAYEEAAAAAPSRPSEAPATPGGVSGAWQVAVRSQSTDPAVDLDVFGVTTTGLGPYAFGARTQAVADAAGHDLLAPAATLAYCDTVAPGRAAGVSRGDLTVTVVNDRVVRFDFSTPRFTFDGLGVGSTAEEITRRYPDADVSPTDLRFDRDRVTIAADGDGVAVVFDLVGDVVARYRVGIARHLEPAVPCR